MSSYTTLEKVQAELKLVEEFSPDTNPTDDTVTGWIAEASSYIDSLTENMYTRNTVTSTYLDYDGEGILRLPHNDIYTINSLKYNINPTGLVQSWITLEEGTDKNFILYNDFGEVKFVSGINSTNKLLPVSGDKKFCVSYIHGTNTIPGYISTLATLLVVKRIIMSSISSQSNSEGGAIRVGTISISDPSTFSVNYIKGLSEEIDYLENKIGLGFKVRRVTRMY